MFDENGNYQGFESHAYGHVHEVDPGNLDGLWEAYLKQISYADKLLGEMIERLKIEGIWDDTVLVVTADHGARREFPTEDESIQIENMTPNVPLFIKAPGIGPSTPHLAYQHVDFGPTLLDILNTPAPTRDLVSPELRGLIGEGRSIFGMEDEPRSSPFFVNVEYLIYWRYDFDPVAKAWKLTNTHKDPIPDKTVVK
jgi:arylsulfatase A-like enzyme